MMGFLLCCSGWVIPGTSGGQGIFAVAGLSLVRSLDGPVSSPVRSIITLFWLERACSVRECIGQRSIMHVCVRFKATYQEDGWPIVGSHWCSGPHANTNTDLDLLGNNRPSKTYMSG